MEDSTKSGPPLIQQGKKKNKKKKKKTYKINSIKGFE